VGLKGPPDFQSYFHSTPGLYLVVTPEFKIVDASAQYVQTTLLWNEDFRGHSLFEVFPDNPNDPHDGVRNLKASLQEVLKNGMPDRMAVQRYDVRDYLSDEENWVEKYWAPVNRPICPPGSREITHILHQVVDKTSAVRLAQRLDKELIINLEQRAMVESWLGGAKDRHEELIEAKIEIEKMLRSAENVGPMVDAISRRLGMRDESGYSYSGDPVPVTGLYDAFHQKRCELSRHLTFLMEPGNFPACACCPGGVIYRFRRKL
jgi:hypothetical protein